MSNNDDRPLIGIVTGAASGMGRAAVEAIRPLVDEIICVDLFDPGITGTRESVCDVTDPAAVHELARTVRGAGQFRALAHAAAVSPSMAPARRVFEIDLVGTELLLRAFQPLVTAGSAAVCFSSLAAHIFMPHVDQAMEDLLADPLSPDFLDRAVAAVDDSPELAYAYAKVGVVRAAARHCITWADRGGRVNSLAPGLIDTPMGQKEFAVRPSQHQMLATTPLGRLGRPEEVAHVAAFLLSDQASYVTGIDLLVDGGQLQGDRTANRPTGTRQHVAQ